MFKKILVCLDGSEFSEQILPYAVEQARQFNSKIVLLKVGTTSPLVMAVTPPEQYRLVASVTVDAVIQEEQAQAERYLRRVAENISAEGLEVDSITVLGPTSEAVVKFVRELDIDLIAMTTHAYRGWKRLFLGSTLDSVLRECGVPVLVINPRETQRVDAS